MSLMPKHNPWNRKKPTVFGPGSGPIYGPGGKINLPKVFPKKKRKPKMEDVDTQATSEVFRHLALGITSKVVDSLGPFSFIGVNLEREFCQIKFDMDKITDVLEDDYHLTIELSTAQNDTEEPKKFTLSISDRHNSRCYSSDFGNPTLEDDIVNLIAEYVKGFTGLLCERVEEFFKGKIDDMKALREAMVTLEGPPESWECPDIKREETREDRNDQELFRELMKQYIRDNKSGMKLDFDRAIKHISNITYGGAYTEKISPADSFYKYLQVAKETKELEDDYNDEPPF